MPEEPSFKNQMIAELDQRWTECVDFLVEMPEPRLQRFCELLQMPAWRVRHEASVPDLEDLLKLACLGLGEAWRRGLDRIKTGN